MRKWLCILMAVPVIFLGCNMFNRDFSRPSEDFPDPSKGSLVIFLDGRNIPTQTIVPAASTTVGEYRLTFDYDPGAGGNLNDFTLLQGSTVYNKPQMVPGNWTVKVEALNTDSPAVLIGDYHSEPGATPTLHPFTITAGAQTAFSLDVEPLTGSGTFRLYVSWPDGAGIAETLTAQLDGTILVNADPGSDATTRVVDSSTSQTAGYHTLTLRLEDGGVLLWGWMEAVRILSGVPTDTTDPVNSDKFVLSLAGAGELDVTLNQPVFQNPIVVGISPSGFQVTQNDPAGQTITATPLDASYTYAWYIDGNLVQAASTGVNTYSLVPANFTPALSVGSHNLSALVNSGALSSATVSFTVVVP